MPQSREKGGMESHVESVKESLTLTQQCEKCSRQLNIGAKKLALLSQEETGQSSGTQPQ